MTRLGSNSRPRHVTDCVGSDVVVDSLFYILPIVCGGSAFGLCFIMHYLVNFLVLQSSWRERES